MFQIQGFLWKSYLLYNLIQDERKYFCLFKDSFALKVALSQKVEVDFPNCPKWVPKKTILGFRKWKFWLFFAFTSLIYFQVLQIGDSRIIINHLIKPVNANKAKFSFFKSQASFFGTHFGQLGKSTSTFWLKATFNTVLDNDGLFSAWVIICITGCVNSIWYTLKSQMANNVTCS